MSRRILATGPVYVLAIALASVHVVHSISTEQPLLLVLVDTAVPLLLTFCIFYTGFWSYRNLDTPRHVLRITTWVYVGAVAMAVSVGLIVVHQLLSGSALENSSALFANAATGGGLAGFLIGVFDARNRRRSARIETILSATRELMHMQTKTDVCERTVDVARNGLDMAIAAVWLSNDERTALVPVAATDESNDLFDNHPVFTADNSLAWSVFENGEILLVDDLREEDDVHNAATPLRSELLVPLGPYGVLGIGSIRRNAFDDVDVTTAEVLASTTVAALYRADRERALREQRRTLKRQTARLESFADTVSHDLRNPLNVATGHVESVRETGDEEYLDAIETSLDRMRAIIDDLLWLAREGRKIGDVEPVSLEAVVRTAWKHVETEDAQLRCRRDRTLVADPQRLEQLFENLFRNAVEHGGSDVTVTVGVLEDGFFVEDTGPGVPPENRDSILEAGFTTADDGTGFGLSIVETVVEAHGWTMSVTDSVDATAGARFEFTGVDAPRSDTGEPVA